MTTEPQFGVPLTGKLEDVAPKDADAFFRIREPDIRAALADLEIGEVKKYKIPTGRTVGTTRGSLTRMARNRGIDLEYAPNAPEGFIVFRVIQLLREQPPLLTIEPDTVEVQTELEQTDDLVDHAVAR